MSASILHFSSIAKKAWMSLLGLFLVLFLVVHLSINLCLLRDDGGAWFTTAATFMGTNYVVKVFEVVLFGSFILHIFLGIVLQLRNWMSRPVRYHVTNKTETRFLSKYMIYTGGIVFIFLVIHMMNFYFIKLGWVGQNAPRLTEGEPDFYTIAKALFHVPAYSMLYIVLFMVLGFHLFHAFRSAFQSLGLDNKRYTPVINVIGTIYAIVIPLGFIIIPLYFLLS
jgi:succinate dehydrogenase / fumarate reductase, cytochrome b subunit